MSEFCAKVAKKNYLRKDLARKSLSDIKLNLLVLQPVYSITNQKNKAMRSFIPHISNRSLLFVAAAVWTFAGGMLISRGVSGLIEFPAHVFTKLAIAATGGAAFYLLLFTRISSKYVKRIIDLQNRKVPFYSFFNLRGYIMMTLMITLGITIRRTGMIPFEYLAVFYLTMGTPLLVSAFKFLYAGITFKKTTLP